MSFKSQDNNPHSFDVRTDENNFQLEQNVEAYKDYARQSRQADEDLSSTRQYRSFAIIPDIIAIDILTRYGLDVHSPEFMGDPVSFRKFKQIIMSEFPDLLTSNIRNV
jgi:hypothetical protein